MENELEKIPCETCKKEIPASVALTPEGMEIVSHFCSFDCMDYWQGIEPD